MSAWKRGSGLHRHHILPVHAGGTDEPHNFTYLTVREHIIAHYLLWKIHKNPNDLRSMKMLGVNLNIEYRRIIGNFCVTNKIGIHGQSFEERSNAGKIGGAIARDNKLGFHAMTAEQWKEVASMGGKIGGKKCYENGSGIFSLTEEERLQACSKGGKITGPLKKGIKYWTKDGVKVSSRTCPGEGWENYIILSQKYIEAAEYKRNTKRFKLINSITNQSEMFVLDSGISFEQFLLNAPEWNISNKAIAIEKHGIFVRVDSSMIRDFINLGWKIVHTKEKNRREFSEMLAEEHITMRFQTIKTRIPIRLKDVFLKEGWTTIDENNKQTWVFLNGYRINAMSKDIDLYKSFGWIPVDYRTKPKPVSERYPGCKMVFTETGVGIQIAFADVRFFEKHGLSIQAKDKTEYKRIQKEINKVSSEV